MPAWPTVGRTDDHQLLQALRRADAEAPAGLYDSYAERLNDYACSLLGDPEAAAEAVHDALVTAWERVDRLRDPGRLRPWLYALVRARCESGPRAAARGRAPASNDHGDPRERELATLVHEALAELDGRERQALELSLRHDLSPAEVGAVLGLTSRQATATANRARDHLENSAAAVVLAKVGRAHCPDLSAMVDSWEGPLTTMLRRRLSSHIGRCEVCMERRDRHVSATGLLDLAPPAFPPLSLRRRTIETCVNPERAAARASITSADDRFDRSGFPTAGGRAKTRGGAGLRRAPVRRRGRTRRATPVVVAAFCVLAATGVMVAATGDDIPGGPGGADGRVGAAPTGRPPQPSPTSAPAPGPAPESAPDPDPAEDPAEAPEEPPPTPSPSRSARTASAVPAPSRSRPPTPRRPATEPPRTTRPPAVPPAAPRLAVSCPTKIEQGSGQIRLTAHNGVISWSATTSGGLDIRPRRGRLRAGAGGVIWVTASDPGESGSGRVSFTSAGGGSSCAISWESPAPEASEPVDDPPPEPTGNPPEAPDVEAGAA